MTPTQARAHLAEVLADPCSANDLRYALGVRGMEALEVLVAEKPPTSLVGVRIVRHGVSVNSVTTHSPKVVFTSHARAVTWLKNNIQGNFRPEFHPIEVNPKGKSR